MNIHDNGRPELEGIRPLYPDRPEMNRGGRSESLQDGVLSDALLDSSRQKKGEGKVIELEPALKEAVSQVNETMAKDHRVRLRFEMVRELDTPVLRVIDVQTNEVVRQIPSEESLQRMRALRQQMQDAQATYDNPRMGSVAPAAAGALLDETG